MRVVVVGATGNTGVWIVKALSGAGHEVVAVTRDPQGQEASNLAKLPGVVAKKEEDAFTQSIDRLYLATRPTFDHFIHETDLIIAARKAGVKYIVKLSTVDKWMHVYGDRFYARSHLAVEYFLEHGDVPFTCIRANLFHNWVGVDFEEVAKTKEFSSRLGGAAVASVDPRDIADVASALLLMPDPAPHYSKKYMLTGPKDENDQSISDALSEVLQTDIKCTGLVSEEELKRRFEAQGIPKNKVDEMIQNALYFTSGLGAHAHSHTSPEVLAIAPPSRTFKDYVQYHYSKKQ